MYVPEVSMVTSKSPRWAVLVGKWFGEENGDYPNSKAT